jgi:hypothetical protein
LRATNIHCGAALLLLLLLSDGMCLYRQDGLWTYELCHRQQVRQFRQVTQLLFLQLCLQFGISGTLLALVWFAQVLRLPLLHLYAHSVCLNGVELLVGVWLHRPRAPKITDCVLIRSDIMAVTRTAVVFLRWHCGEVAAWSSHHLLVRVYSFTGHIS